MVAASQNRSIDMIGLLSAGANIDCKDRVCLLVFVMLLDFRDGGLGLIAACLYCARAVFVRMRFFSLWSGAFGAFQRFQGGWTPLIRAARSDHMDCTRVLLEAGADKEAKTNVRDFR